MTRWGVEVEIPGYKIQREVGRGPTSRVFLGLQHALGSTVAIKVTMLPARDPAFRERLLKAGEVAKGLEHPNIVRVLEVGALDGAVYEVMEYIRGGDLKRNLASGLHMQNLLMATKDVAAALDHAHARGVVHGNLAPGNILFDEQGAVRVSGFGSGAAVAGAEVSPYWSPEQASGRTPDTRSDFYSLGVVFYEMLVGRLAGQGQAGQGAVVRLREWPLPMQFAAFQGVVDRLLANSPDDRFQSGLQVASALDEVRAQNAVPDVVVRTVAITTGEIASAETVHSRQRTAPSHDAGAVTSFRRPVLFAATLAGLATVIAGAWYVTAQGGWSRALAFVGLAEHPDAVVAWEQAEDLRLDRNQSLSAVVSAYRRVQAYEPNHPGAALAIDAVAERWQSEVNAALDVGDVGLANAKLNEIATVFPRQPDLAVLFGHLENQRQAQKLLADTKRLLTRWSLANLRSADAAIASYKEVLRLDPGNLEAAAGLNEIALYYGAAAARDAASDIATAMDSFRRAVAASEQFEGVDAVRATLAAAEAVQAEIDANLQQAAQMRQAGSLIAPPGANPLEIYRRVLATDPDNPIAQQGLSEITATVLAQFDNLLRRRTLEAAREFKDQAAAAGVGDTLVAEMATRYDDELARIDAVKALITEAEKLYSQGYVTGPDAEDNAVALLREALRLDPDNRDGHRLLSVSATRLADVAQEAHDVGMAVEALQYLDLALTVTPGIERWREQREMWQAEVDQARPR